MGKNFKTSAAAAFITGIARTVPESDTRQAPQAPVPDSDVSPSPIRSLAPEQETAPVSAPSEPTAEPVHQIDGREVVVIYRRPRKGDKVERRSRQAHLLMLPSLYKESQKFAKANGTSFNGLVEDALIYYMEKHKKN